MNLQLFDFYSKRIKIIRQVLKKMHHGYSPDDLHKLRIEIKRLYAFFQIMQILFPDDFNLKKQFSPYKDLFNNSGRIRELQMILKQLNSFQISPVEDITFKFYLLKKIKKRKSEFNRILAEADFGNIQKNSRKYHKMCDSLDQDQVVPGLEKYISLSSNAIKTLVLQIDCPENLHGIRKHLKALLVAFRFKGELISPDTYCLICNDLHKTEESIGQWHDGIIFLTHLKVFLERKNSARFSNLAELYNQLEIENTQKYAQSAAELQEAMKLIKL